MSFYWQMNKFEIDEAEKCKYKKKVQASFGKNEAGIRSDIEIVDFTVKIVTLDPTITMDLTCQSLFEVKQKFVF